MIGTKLLRARTDLRNQLPGSRPRASADDDALALVERDRGFEIGHRLFRATQDHQHIGAITRRIGMQHQEVRSSRQRHTVVDERSCLRWSIQLSEQLGPGALPEHVRDDVVLGSAALADAAVLIGVRQPSLRVIQPPK